MIGKLKGRSVQELTDRLAQYGRAMSERHGFLKPPVIPASVPLRPDTPWPLCDRDLLRRHTPAGDVASIVALANSVVQGEFAVLGLRGVSYGSPVDWQRDPVSGRKAPLRHWSRVPYLDAAQVGDHKVIWEVNRHQWLITLGQAWQLTGDVRYPQAAARLLREWLDSNPPKQGINWCSSLELAFRVQSWIHAFRLFTETEAFGAALQHDLLMSAALQVEHITHNLSTWFSPNTHLTGEALAMLSAGCAWHGLPNAAHWRAHGWKVLCDELPRQLRDDGVYFEQSVWYQAYTVDFYLLAMAWAAHASLAVPTHLRDRVHAAARALRAVTRPDGTMVRLGDDDGGHALPLVPVDFGDSTATLWRAAHVFEDEALIPPTDSGRSTLLWLEGSEAFLASSRWHRPDLGRASAVFPGGGWVTLSERGPAAHRDHWLVMDCGPHGALSYAHAHADALGIDLSVQGVPVFVDAGTGAYVGEQRRRYRSTSMHNTVTVDGLDSSEQGGAFGWRSAAASQLDAYAVSPRASFCSAWHNGYGRLSDPVRHQRAILRIAGLYWLVIDTLDASAEHSTTFTLQLAPAAQVSHVSARAFRAEVAGVAVHVALDPQLAGMVEARAVSPAYGLELPAPAIVGSARFTGRAAFCCAIADDAEAGPITVQSVRHGVWRIEHRAGHDVIAHGGRDAVTVGPATFDGQMLAVLGVHEPHRIVAAGAGTLHLAGHAIRLGTNDVRVASRAPAGNWIMES
jgi:hypothetical protein